MTIDPNVKGAISEFFDKSHLSEPFDVPAGCTILQVVICIHPKSGVSDSGAIETFEPFIYRDNIKVYCDFPFSHAALMILFTKTICHTMRNIYSGIEFTSILKNIRIYKLFIPCEILLDVFLPINSAG